LLANKHISPIVMDGH